MRLIGVGFGRTGTMSLKAALERLGAGPCFHMIDLIQGENKERDLPYWIRIANGEQRSPELWGVIEKLVWQGDFQGRFEDRDWVREMYDERIATLKREIGEDRLTVWELGKDGWAPLCRILGADVPDEPFPRLHD